MEPPAWVTNEQSWWKNCRRIVARSGDLIEGRLGVIPAAQQLAKLRHWVRADDDRDFDIFTAIESDSDHLPIGSERQHWAPDALAKKDVEIREIEEFYRANALEAARKLQAKYATRPNQALQRTAGRSDV